MNEIRVMARNHASAPNGPETFQQLKALLGRLPTVDELSRELDPAPSRPRSGRRFMVVGVIGLPLLAMGLFVGLPSSPDLPRAPAVEMAEAPPVLPPVELPAVEPPPPPPPAIEKAPIRRAAPARATATPNAIQRRVLPAPSASARRTITGRIKINVRVSVDPSGDVTEASSLSPDASKYFNGLAVKAAREWKFAPAPDGGDAAREWVLRFGFARQDTNAAATPAAP